MVSLIILSYNTKELLKSCLSSVYDKLHDIDFEIIVVDNASSDDSAHMIKKNFPKVKLIESKVNLGFAKGINKGSRYAKEEYLLFLNSDTTVLDNSIKEMIKFIEANSSIGVVGGRLINKDHRVESSFGDNLSIIGICQMLFGGRGLRSSRKVNSPSPVDWVSGGFMLVRKTLFEKLGGFDENFFMYIEDMEFCFRIKKLGFSVYYYPQTNVVHLGQGSSNRSFAILQIYKGLPYFFKKHKGILQYLLVITLLRIKAILAILVGMMTNNLYLVRTYRQAMKF